MSIPQNKAGWRQLAGRVWHNEQAAAAPVRLGQLFKRGERQLLGLQIYCLRGSNVQNKVLGRFKQLIQTSCSSNSSTSAVLDARTVPPQ